MRKMRLELEALEVESFDTQGRGGVKAREDSTVVAGSCDGTCGWMQTCNAAASCYQAQTCGYTCGTCDGYATCDPSCADTECVTACQGGGGTGTAVATCNPKDSTCGAGVEGWGSW